ncbi:MAG: hypothetical protein WC346_18455 [Methanogenium sp.]|jgi:hypothetical protein
MFANARKIIVNNELFYYKVSGFVNLNVQRDFDGVKKTYYAEVKRKWKTQITPKFVEKFIKKEYFGEPIESKQIFLYTFNDGKFLKRKVEKFQNKYILVPPNEEPLPVEDFGDYLLSPVDMTVAEAFDKWMYFTKIENNEL